MPTATWPMPGVELTNTISNPKAAAKTAQSSPLSSARYRDQERGKQQESKTQVTIIVRAVRG